jgi:N-acetylmuramic acid 6-phosphate etherase
MTDLPKTEAVNPRTRELDERPVREIVHLLADEHRLAVDAVIAVEHVVAKAVEEITARLRKGGRLHYVGAGSSGRIGFLDASEMPPTFGTDAQLVCAHTAGGTTALIRAIENAEDDAEAGDREMRDHVRPGDAVIGISASGTTPYVVAAVQAAKRIGAWTAGVANSAGSPLVRSADLGIVLDTGAEPIAGSTRLKAGTAQKILLNTISTAVMVRLGKVHGNLMIDMVATSSKLRKRALRLLMLLTDEREEQARELLGQAQGNVKVAVLMAAKRTDATAARSLLESSGGSLRAALRQ